MTQVIVATQNINNNGFYLAILSIQRIMYISINILFLQITNLILYYIAQLQLIRSKMQKDFFEDYNGFVTNEGNVIWAAAMQLAWNQLRDKFAHKKPLAFKTQAPVALKTISNFNDGLVKREDISQNCIYVKSGYGQQTLDIINKEVKQKFPKKEIPPIKANLHPNDIISYAYLFKEIFFETKFNRRKDKSFLFKNIPTESFFADTEAQKKQIYCHYYESSNSFMVQIRGKQNKDSIFLIKNKQMTLEQAIATVKKSATKGTAQQLKKIDRFQMPVIKLKADRSYNQMIGLHLANPELAGYLIGAMFESVNLNIDESGAKVQNQAVIMMLKYCKAQKESPKEIILNSQFWIVMKERLNVHPYLCVYINQPIPK